MADNGTQYRNISGETLWVDMGDGRLVKVGDGDLLTVPSDYLGDHYMQTGDTGETPLWESAATTTKKSASTAPAAEIKE